MLLEHGMLFSRSSATLRLARGLGGVWSLFYLLMIVPQPLRDAAYRLLARYRYRMFGQSDACMIPNSRCHSTLFERVCTNEYLTATQVTHSSARLGTGEGTNPQGPIPLWAWIYAIVCGIIPA
jgi:hypothetical protein